MAEVIAFDVIGRLLEYFGNSASKKIAPYFGGRVKLMELEETMRMIQARLLDAERQREGEEGALVKLWLKRLKRVLYRLEDLFEDVSFADREHELMMEEGGQITKPVRFLLLKSRRLKKNRIVSKEVKAIMNDLQGIKLDMDMFNLRVQSTHQDRHVLDVISRRETHSFVREGEVIGREDDKSAILKMLLESNHEKDNVAVISIVGIGGLGKTTLAQLCYSDSNVEQSFELKGWVCISETSSLKEVVRKILCSLNAADVSPRTSIEDLQIRLREVVSDKKYLLVLDDIWDEDRERWLHLKHLLASGKCGSKIIVTTRSKVVARNMGAAVLYELGGLPDDKSWALFRSLAFGEGQEENHPNLTGIGREIVRKCANVPLTIRTMASLLYSKETEEEWSQIKNSDLRTIDQDENGIIATLKLSYNHLSSHLKQCFAYCSLYPKDYEFDKERLIWLWMAQGFIEPLDKGQSLEDVGHGYFMELSRRCFFQEITTHPYGRIKGCKMHDLMHDLACEVGDECMLVDEHTGHVNGNVMHVSVHNKNDKSSWESPSWLLDAKQIRSLFLYINWRGQPTTILNLGNIFSRLRSLRVLELSNMKCHNLPESIGKMKHLRYLKVCVSSESLPECITGLQNLQTLILENSKNLRELPTNFGRLINLRHLRIGGLCKHFNDMPPGFKELASLQSFDVFVIGNVNGLNALASLNLAGRLCIRYRKYRPHAISEAKMTNLKGKKLNSLVFEWSSLVNEEPIVDAEDEFKYLQPPSTLENLTVRNWKGVRFPSWRMDESPCFLPNLVSICVSCCERCQHLPPFSRLPHLKSLVLWNLAALEYIENRVTRANNSGVSEPYFPSLENLELHVLEELKAWLRAADDNGSLSQQLHFPRLAKLRIGGCPKLMSMPLAPRLVTLYTTRIHGKLLNQLLVGEEAEASSSLSEPDSLSLNLSSLESLEIRICHELQSMNVRSSISLRRLNIDSCQRLKDILSALRYLSSLDELKISCCPELDFGNYDNSVGGDVDASREHILAWQGIKNLRSLSLRNLPKVPSGLGCLVNLVQLEIDQLWNLTTLPEYIGVFSHLRDFQILECPQLTDIPESFGNLSQLHALRIKKCPKLIALPESFGNLNQLRKLRIKHCPELTALPESFGDLAMLSDLGIEECPQLTSLPRSFSNLTALQRFFIWKCPELIERCKQPDGADWHLVQHIPHLSGCGGNT